MNFTAETFLQRLHKLATTPQKAQYERLFTQNKTDQFIGVKMGNVFKLAKEYNAMELDEIEKLLKNPLHEARVGAVSIMDYQARDKKTSDDRRKELFQLYIKCHDHINTWDLVDRSCIYVVGSYLSDKPRDILYTLARSKHMPERRTAIVSTAYFMMKQKDCRDTFKIAEILVNDDQDLVLKAVGWMLRVAGDIDREELIMFLDKHSSTMPRVMVRYAIEKFDQAQKQRYMKKV